MREQVRSDLEVRASDLDLSLLMSTVTNLTDFIEDEILPGPLPMQVSGAGPSLYISRCWVQWCDILW